MPCIINITQLITSTGSRRRCCHLGKFFALGMFDGNACNLCSVQDSGIEVILKQMYACR